MQLTMFTDYALRVLMYTDAANDRLVTIEEIAEAYGISRAHLMKVVNTLTRAGFITPVRGRFGGLKLARPAKDIQSRRRGAGDGAEFRCCGMLFDGQPVPDHAVL